MNYWYSYVSPTNESIAGYNSFLNNNDKKIKGKRDVIIVQPYGHVWGDRAICLPVTTSFYPRIREQGNNYII